MAQDLCLGTVVARDNRVHTRESRKIWRGPFWVTSCFCDFWRIGMECKVNFFIFYFWFYSGWLGQKEDLPNTLVVVPRRAFATRLLYFFNYRKHQFKNSWKSIFKFKENLMLLILQTRTSLAMPVPKLTCLICANRSNPIAKFDRMSGRSSSISFNIAHTFRLVSS